jgi:hypothetical protein
MAYTSDMYVTIHYVKCKTRKCGETIPLEKLFESGETRELLCRRGHANEYDGSCAKRRTVKPLKGLGVKKWR